MGEITGMKAAFQGNTDTLINLLLNNLTEAESSNGMLTHPCSALQFDLITIEMLGISLYLFQIIFHAVFLAIA